MAERLITLNIEGNKHFDRFLPVLKNLNPSIVCFQELYEVDCNYLAQELGMSAYQYLPTVKVEKPSDYENMRPRGNWGIGMMTKLDVKQWETFRYGPDSELKVFEQPNDPVPSIIIACLSNGKEEYQIASTHFTWSNHGEATDRQRQDFTNLQAILANYPELVLCGDFNAPRGREIFSLFETLFKDNVPAEVTTTIDNDLHYAHKNLQLVVDTIFTTPGYQASNVQILNGVSDHMGIYAEISSSATTTR